MTSQSKPPTAEHVGALEQLWGEFAAAIGAAPAAIFQDDVPDDPQLRLEGYRYFTRLLRAGIAICIEHDDPNHPDFTRLYEPYNSYGIDNPDYHYLIAPVDGDGTFTITGTLGNADFVDVMVQAGHFSTSPGNEVISTLDSRKVDIAPNGEFHITISPDEHPGAWLESNERASYVLIRECFMDWSNPQHSMQVRIERSDAAYPPVNDPTAQLRGMERLRDWMTVGLRAWDGRVRSMCLSPGSNTMQWLGTGDSGGGKAGQHYGFGNFDLDPDTAIVIEFEPPTDAYYWMFGTGSWYWETFDPWRRQVSINHTAAHLDRDGRFRAVVAGSDPGVPNWLDTAGNQHGILVARCIDALSVATPEYTTVPLAQLRDVLPPETPVVTPEERAETLRRRHAAGRGRMRV